MDKEARNGQNDEFKKFQQLLKQVLTVPKEHLDERRAEYDRQKKERKRPR